MGILKSIASDVEELVDLGYSDKEISVSVGMDKNVIQFMIDYFRNEKKYNKDNQQKLNTR